MFIRANIGNIIIAIVAILILIFFRSSIKSIPLIYIIFLCYLDIWLFKIAFEYQRITLIISRIAKINHSQPSIPELQILLTDDTFAFQFFLKSFLSGFIIGYFLLNSIILLIVFLLLESLFSNFIPGYIPYNYLFKLIDKELNKDNFENVVELFEKNRLKKYFNEIPHTSNYEDWAYKKYGNELLTIK